MTKKFTYLLMTFLTLNAVCATSSSAANQSENNMIKLDETRSYCIGRYVVDIPAEAYQSGQYDQYNSFYIEVEKNVKKQDFDAVIKKVQTDYSKYGQFITEDLPEQKIEGRFTKVIKAKTSSTPGGPFTVFGFVFDQGHLFLIEGGHSDLPDWTARSDEAMQHLIQNLRYRHENEIPKENGQCITNGFIKDNDKIFRHNRQSMIFEFKDYPTVILRFRGEVHSKPYAQLIPRVEGKLKKVTGATFLSNRNLIRKGEKNTSLFTGQEWIEVERMKGRNGLIAIWEHTGLVRHNADPTLNFEVDTALDHGGRIGTSSLSKPQALQLYETILKSIRKIGE